MEFSETKLPTICAIAMYYYCCFFLGKLQKLLTLVELNTIVVCIVVIIWLRCTLSDDIVKYVILYDQ